MTWYWWKHWFWITGLITLVITFTSVEASPMTPLHKDYKKDKNLKILPLAGPTDIFDNVFNGNNEPAGLMIHNNRENKIYDSKIKDNLNGNHSVKIISDTIEENITKNSNETELKISNKEYNSKDYDLSIESNKTNKNNNLDLENSHLNNTNININNNNHNISISTNSSVEIISNASQSVVPTVENQSTCNNTVTVTLNSTLNNYNTSNNVTIDCENDSNEESLEESSSLSSSSSQNNNNNKTNTIHVDLIDNDGDDDDDDVDADTVIARGGDDYNHTNTNDKGKEYKNNKHNNTIVIGNIMKVHNKGKQHLENQTKDEEITRAEIQRQLDGERGRKSKVLSEYKHEIKYINFTSDAKNLLARSAAPISLEFDEQDDENVSSEALSIQKAYILDAGTISGICLSVLGLFFAFTLSGFALYRRRYLNKPQTLSEPDSSGYIDDSTIRDNSDEMYSLDNDSFLNSLEAMTIQNYWTDTVKHTKL